MYIYIRIYICICIYIYIYRRIYIRTELGHQLAREELEFNTLQHTTSLSITLQHIATHYNTLQHTATHCITLYHTATHLVTKEFDSTHCGHTKYPRPEFVHGRQVICSNVWALVEVGVYYTISEYILQHMHRTSSTGHAKVSIHIYTPTWLHD